MSSPSPTAPFSRNANFPRGLEKARDLANDVDGFEAGRLLGNGHEIAAYDTVPLCLWSVAVNPDCFESAIWRVLLAGGDQDTTAAITGGVIAGRTAPPREWVALREALPEGLSA